MIVSDSSNVSSAVSDQQVPQDNRTREEIIAEYEAQKAAEVQRLEAEKAAKQAEFAKRREENRIERNKQFDSQRVFFNPDYEGYSSGVRGYHFLKNFKANDGNYYAEYGANRGDNRRYYSISEGKWYNDAYLFSKYCNHCNETFSFMPNGFANTCPNCGATYTDRYDKGIPKPVGLQ